MGGPDIELRPRTTAGAGGRAGQITRSQDGGCAASHDQPTERSAYFVGGSGRKPVQPLTFAQGHLRVDRNELGEHQHEAHSKGDG